MALNPAVLREALRPLFQPEGMPASVQAAVAAWGRAYVRYAQFAMAGVTVPGPLSAPGVAGEFLTALDASLRAMWMATAWAGPGFTGATAAVPALQPFLLSHAGALSSSFDRELGLSLITEAVHTYTLSITVAVVPPGGTPTIVPLA